MIDNFNDSFIIRNMQKALEITADFNADDSEESDRNVWEIERKMSGHNNKEEKSANKIEKNGKGKGHVTFQGDTKGVENSKNPDDFLMTGSSMEGDHLAKLSSLAAATKQGGGRSTFTVNPNKKKSTSKGFRRASVDAGMGGTYVRRSHGAMVGRNQTIETNGTTSDNKKQEPLVKAVKVKKKRKNTRRQDDFHDLGLDCSRISWGSDDEMYNRRGSMGSYASSIAGGGGNKGKSGGGGKGGKDDFNGSDREVARSDSEVAHRSNESSGFNDPWRKTNPHTGDSDSETAASEGYDRDQPGARGDDDEQSQYESQFSKLLRRTSMDMGTSFQKFTKRLSNGSQPSQAGGMAYGGGGVTGPYGGGGPGHAHHDSYDLSVPVRFDHSLDQNGRPIRSSRRRRDSNESEDLSSYGDDDHREVWDDLGWDDIRHRRRGVFSNISNLLPWGGRTDYPRYHPQPSVHRGCRKCMAIMFILAVVTLSSYFISFRVTQNEAGLRGKDKMETIPEETAEIVPLEAGSDAGESNEDVPSLSEALDLPSSTGITSTTELLNIADDIVESCNTPSLSTAAGRIACQKLCHDHTCCFDYSGDGYYCGDDESKMCILYAGCEVLVVGGWVEGELGGIDEGEEWDDEEEDYWSADEQDEADAATGKGGGDGASGSGGSAGAAGTFNSAQIARSIVNKCNEPSLATPSGLQECHSLCQDHLCCFEDTAEENCLDSRRDLRDGQKVEDDTKERAMECLLYAGCAGLLDHPDYLLVDSTSGGSIIGGSDANTAVNTEGQNDDVLHYCSESNLESSSGRSECDAICSAHMCCFEESNRGVGVYAGGSCKSQKKREECPEYAGCVVLALDEDGDGILDSTQADATDEVGETEEVPVFSGWGGADSLNSDPDANPSDNPLNPSFLPAQEVLDHCTLELIQTQNGRLQCESICAHHMCCFDEDLELNCQDDLSNECVAYSGCVILVYDLMEEGMSVLEMELDLDEEETDDGDGKDNGGEDDYIFDNTKENEKDNEEEVQGSVTTEEASDPLAVLEGFNNPNGSGTTSDASFSTSSEVTSSSSSYSMADVPPPPPRCRAFPSTSNNEASRSHVYTDDWNDDKYDRCRRWERKYKIRIVDYYAQHNKDTNSEGEDASDDSSAGAGADGAEGADSVVPNDDINQTDDDKFTYSSYESGQKTQEETQEESQINQGSQTVTDPLAELVGFENNTPQDEEDVDEDEDTTWEEEVDDLDDDILTVGEVEEENVEDGDDEYEVDDAVEDNSWEDEGEFDDDMLIIGEVGGDTRSGDTADDAIGGVE